MESNGTVEEEREEEVRPHFFLFFDLIKVWFFSVFLHHYRFLQEGWWW